jgi:TonB family protein
MYDDLARTQNPTPLEWFVVHALIPTVLVTAALHWSPAPPATLKHPSSVMVWPPPCCPFVPWPGPVADVFPTLVRMPEPAYPEAMRRAGIEGRVVLKALVNTRGRVYPSSILVLRATHVQFVAPARAALTAALFRPGWFGGQRTDAWITIAIDFPDTSE